MIDVREVALGVVLGKDRQYHTVHLGGQVHEIQGAEIVTEKSQRKNTETGGEVPAGVVEVDPALEAGVDLGEEGSGKRYLMLKQ